jgi:hypothetical protein
MLLKGFFLALREISVEGSDLKTVSVVTDWRMCVTAASKVIVNEFVAFRQGGLKSVSDFIKSRLLVGSLAVDG